MNIYKITIILLVNILLLTSLKANENKLQINFTKTEQEFIKKHPIIKFSDVIWKPFSHIKNKKHSGIFNDYYQIIEQRTGLKFQFVQIDNGINFQKVLDALKNKEIDMIDGTGKTKQRAKYSLFTDPIMEVSLSIVSHKLNKYTNLNELKDKRVVLAKGGTAFEYLKEKYPNKKFILTEGIEEGLRLINNKKADALIDNIVVLDYLIKNNRFKNIEISGIPKYEFKIYSLIRDDYYILKEILNKAIKSIKKEELYKINNKLLLASLGPRDENIVNFEKKIISDISIRNKNIITFNKKEIKYLQNKKEISLCVDPNWMPFNKMQGNKQIGINSDFIKIFESNINIPIKILKTKTWQESLVKAKEKKCDLISLISSNKERKEYLNFTKSYLDTSVVMVSKMNAPTIYDIEALKNKKVAIVKGHSLVKIIGVNYPNLEIIEVNNIEDALEKVKNNEVDSLVENLISIAYYFQKGYHSELKISATLNNKLYLGFAVNKDEKILFNIINRLVENISEAEKQEILNKWFSIKYEKGFDYDLFWKLFFVLFLIWIFFIYRHYEIKRLNKQLKKSVEKELLKSRDKDKLLFHQNKMISMGQMIENIAHQWRQPLSQINSSVLIIDEFLHDNKIKDPILVDKLNEIESMTKYMSDTINDFKDFSSNNKEKLEFNIKEEVFKSVNIIRGSLIYYNIRISIQSDKKEMLYIGYPNELQQALLVILNNAKDILLSRIIEKPEINIKISNIKNKFIIEINDNAGGIDLKIIEKIFEPYFTTKHQSKGTGLGLYISKKIIEDEMNGSIKVENNKKGANFIINFKEIKNAK